MTIPENNTISPSSSNDALAQAAPAADTTTPRRSRWEAFQKLPEFHTLGIAALCIAVIFIWYGILLHANPTKANGMWEIIVKHIIGGAAIGALTGAPSLSRVVTDPAHISKDIIEYPVLLSAETGFLPGAPSATEFSTMENILLNSTISISLIFLVYGLFSLSFHKLFRVKLLDKTFSELENNAASQRKKWQKWGIPGIFIFVWIPLTGTGPIVGAILGRVIGLSYWTNLATVAIASISSITAWAFFAQFINQWLGNKWLNYISNTFVLGVILAIISAKITGYVKKKLEKNKS